MTTKEAILAEIENVRESDLDELYRLIQSFVKTRQQPRTENLMARLREIKIDGPEDLAENHDLYLSGEKNVKADLR